MAPMTADPQKTYALVVGVEKYAAGSTWDLDGPASDASKFVGWLRSWQVPDENIYIYLSPLDKNGSIAGQGAQAATRENIYQALTTILRWKNEGTLFYLFWGGHGMITPDNKRILFYADATNKQNAQNLDLDNLLTSLRSDYFLGFEQQIFFIDACANYVIDWRFYGTLPKQTFPLGDPLTTHEQFVYLAAKPGELAKNVTEQQTGLFSQVVREELAKQGSDRWPPDMELLATSLTERFTKLRVDGMAKQTPIYFWYRNWDGAERLLGGIKEPAFPPIWNVPYPRNPYFTGREGILKKLYDALRADKTAALTQPQAISGLGGIGKTQLAIEYAYHYRQKYQAVLWAQADTTEALKASYTELAKLLRLSQKEALEQEIAVQAVKAWLRNHGGWLLILDNADDLSLVQPFLPTACPGHLILTTRAQITGKVAHRFEVDTLDGETGALLLLRRAGLIAAEGSFDEAFPSDQSIALALVEELGGLPLALDQAGAYVEETQCSLADYQQQYRTQRTELLAHRGMIIDDHPEPVATTWSLSFAKVEQASPLAAELLRACAFLAPDAIPEELLVEVLNTPLPILERTALEGEEGGWFSRLTLRVRKPPKRSLQAVSVGEMRAAVAILRAYSLLQQNMREKMVYIHRLVQFVVQDTLFERMRKAWMARVVCAVNRCFPTVRFETWEQCERYLPHALVCYEWVAQHQIALQEGSSLLNRAGWYLDDRIRYTEAERLYTYALEIDMRRLGANHPDTASSLNNLAELYRNQGKNTEAEPLLVRALEINMRKLGANHPNIVGSLNNLALLYKSQGKYAQAEPLLVRALEINMRKLGANHPDTASSLNNLAGLYAKQERHAEAESLYQCALAIHEQKLGANHPNTANCLNNLAGLYAKQERHAEAESLYRRALAIYEQKLGANHPNTANCLNNLASLYERQGKYAQAEPLYQRALTALKNSLGQNHLSTQNVRLVHTALLRKMNTRKRRNTRKRSSK